LNNYIQLRLDEVDLVLLMHLYNIETSGNSFLSISELANRTTLELDVVADKVDLLVTKGFIALEIIENEGIAEESFSIFATLLKMMDHKQPKQEVNTKGLVDILETELNRPLSSKELQIIQSWNYTVDQVKTAVLDALKQKKMGVEYVNKILENNSKEVAKDMSYFNQFLND
jgi:DNA replication protein DnaD